MIEYLKVNGRIIKWKVMVYSRGLIRGFTKVLIKMTKKKAMELSNGQTEGNTKECGRMENSMERENFSTLRKAFGEKVSGVKAKG
jgi:hypothetical protein